MGIKRCKAAFVTMKGGQPRMLNPGALVDSDDPIVKDYPHHFEDVETYVSDRTAGTVEQATAAPGEKRGRSKPASTKRSEPRPAAGTPKTGTGEGA